MACTTCPGTPAAPLQVMEAVALEMRLLHEAEVLASPPFVVRLSQGFGKVTVTDTSLGDHSPEGTAGLRRLETGARLRLKFEGFLDFTKSINSCFQ